MKNLQSEFQIKRLISHGSFGQVYTAIQKSTKRNVVIKIELGTKQTVKQEKRILSILKGIKGVPKLIQTPCQVNQNILIMEFLSNDLAHFQEVHKKFSLKTTIKLGMELLKIIESIHQRNVLHRDLKPENIMVGGTNDGQIFLIDYGISKQYVQQGQQIPFKASKPFVGTLKYAPIASHKGHEQSPKDDIESLIYILVHLHLGQLPWDDIYDIKQVEKAKENVKLDILFYKMPKEFKEIYEYIRKLHYYDSVNYNYIIKQLQSIIITNKIIIDDNFEWNQNSITLFSEIKNHLNDDDWNEEYEVNYSSSSSDGETIEQKYKSMNQLQFYNPFQ